MRIFLNEYYERKPERLHERVTEELFTLEKTDVNNYEFMSLEEHEKEIQELKALIKEAIPFMEATETEPWKCDDVGLWLSKAEKINETK